MKLYYSPGACSLAPHIALEEAGLPYQAVRVDLRQHKLDDGTDYYTINPKGYVPTLELDDGNRLTEAAVVLQYIADQVAGKLAPQQGTIERYRLIEWLNFIATEIHKGFSPLWKPNTPDAMKDIIKGNLAKRFEYLDQKLGTQPFLTGDRFTVADAYLFTVLSWAGTLGVDLKPFAAVTAYVERIGARPKVQAAMQSEGLLKKAA